MVLQKKLYYGFNGYEVPATPQGLRSARGKRFVEKKVNKNQLCPFELLAAVAGKLLLERETAAVSGSDVRKSKPPVVNNLVKQEQPDELKTFKVEPCDQGSCDEGTLTCEVFCQRPSLKFDLKECSHASSSVVLDPSSVIVESDQSNKTGYHKEVTSDKSKTDITRECFAERHSSLSAESDITKYVDRSPLQSVLTKTKNQTNEFVANVLSSEDPMEFDSKSPILASSNSSIELTPYGKCYTRSSSFPRYRGHMELFNKDDDENFSRCNYPRTSKSSKSQRVEDWRIRKMLASKFWKVGPTLLKDVRFSKNGVKPFHIKKMCYACQRTQKNYFKHKRLFERSSVSISCGEFSCEAMSKVSKMNVKEEECNAATNSHGASGFASSVRCPLSTLNSEECQVKFSMKTIKLPELFIEMPESDTVGALKRTILDAVTAMLKNGLRVGVLLQGKKVLDDTKTLCQAGICHGAKLGSLSFTLEQVEDSTTPLTKHENSHFLDACGSFEPLSWLPTAPTGNSITDTVPNNTITTVAVNQNKNGFVSITSDMSLVDNTSTDPKAIVIGPPVDTEAVAVVPLHRKSRQSAIVQRRIRRPFSVTEVEALVQAVENLGTGRWRDVKLRAFENAKHRTYVDMKDKWKTLVHTARISPQQRRGEPVPQELLNRVLAAHAYWSQQQAKLKQQQQPSEQLLVASIATFSKRKGKGKTW